MRLSQRRRRTIQSIDLTAMVDIIFQLLLFFIVSSTLVLRQHVDAPVPGAGEQHALLNPVQVVIYGEGNYLVNEKNAGDLNTLSELLAQEHVADSGTVQTVIIEGDKSISYSTFVQVLETCQAGGYENISLAVE